MAKSIEFNKIDPKKFITIKGATLHNLKNIDVVIPKNQLVVITGVSGSGKSSLAFDTLFAEGQRRYIESLSSYARQFLGKLDKPQVEYIKGISPAIAIQQKVISNNPRSTVGTVTEIYEYIKLLFARIGRTYSPISGKEVKKDEVSTVIDFIKTLEKDQKLLLYCPLPFNAERSFKENLQSLSDQGFIRLKINEQIVEISDLLSYNYENNATENHFLLIERIVVRHEEDFYHRLSDSVQTCFYEGNGTCLIENQKNKEILTFNNRFEMDGMDFNQPNVHFFSFNNPYGSCPICEGYGSVMGIDEDLVIPNKNLSVYEEAVVAWKGEKMSQWKEEFIKIAQKIDFPIHKPYADLSKKQIDLLWKPTKYFEGLNGFFLMLEQNSYKIQYRVMLSRYRGKTKCPECSGTRLRKETNFVKINEKCLSDLVELPIDELIIFFKELKLNETEKTIAKRLLIEINNRIEFLLQVGLGYLTLNRSSNTLSGGESQRINLATSLGSSLVGSMYILDEPSIGLHSRDTDRLIGVLKKLRDLGNTVIVVEHDEEMIRAADHIIDIGPYAGSEGGEVVFTGNFSDLTKSKTLTANYFHNKFEIPLPTKTRKAKHFLSLKGIRHHNLKNLDVNFPLNVLTVVTGVSGSGKSSLLKDILVPIISTKLGQPKKYGSIKEISGDFDKIKQLELIDQNPIGKSSRSNPVTYVKVYDDIRDLFAKQPLSKSMNYLAKHFSFNVEGGRCEQCKGDGIITVEMQFLADVELICESCNGKRFKKEILDVSFCGKNISDILEMRVDEAIQFFLENNQPKIVDKMQPLKEVGLNYLKLGQSSNTLSGGESQRIKLASYLKKGTNEEPTLFVFDEPSTGLHFYDIKKLVKSFNALIEKGHTVVVIEHHLDIIKCADWIIDLGPEGGKNGGKIIATGSPKEIVANKKGYTAAFLKEKL
jgi:excinuclease ABC subunit A